MIYLDNAATTWPKPPAVMESLGTSLRDFGANPGRGGHSFSLRTGRKVLASRQALASFFNSKRPERWIYTSSATDSVNTAMFGLLQPGDHVIASAIEHNAVARPLHHLTQQGVAVSFLPGKENVASEARDLMRPNTRLLVISHASNVTGQVQPLQDIIALRREADLLLLVDAAQTAGLLPIDVEAGIDLLAIPGHKSLYGPPGIGALYVAPGVQLQPLRFGGTGSKSESREQPETYPDRLESGTLNTPGIFALNAGMQFVQAQGQENLYRKEMHLARMLVTGLRTIPGVIVYSWDDQPQVPVVACNIESTDSNEVAMILDQSFQICSRAGLHCAPLAHQGLGTLGQGVVRFSLGAFNTEEEIQLAISAMEAIARELR
jgi:cysteine desulfurase family protein